jgi:hypothetical protein
MPYQASSSFIQLLTAPPADGPSFHGLAPVVGPELDRFTTGLFGFEYMGKAELEVGGGWGVEKSLRHIKAQHNTYAAQAVTVKLQLGDGLNTTKAVSLYIIAPQSAIGEVAAFAGDEINQQYRRHKLRDAVQNMLDKKGAVTEGDNIGMLDAQHHVMILTNRESFEETAKRFGIAFTPGRNLAS